MRSRQGEGTKKRPRLAAFARWMYTDKNWWKDLWYWVEHHASGDLRKDWLRHRLFGTRTR